MARHLTAASLARAALLLILTLLLAPGCRSSPPAPARQPPERMELARQASACSRSEECEAVLLPRCIDKGCSPPCGRVYPLTPAAVNRQHRERWLAALEQAEQARCRVVCPECIKPEPRSPDLSGLSAACRQGVCQLAEERVWVHRHFQGGRQCEPRPPAPPPSLPPGKRPHPDVVPPLPGPDHPSRTEEVFRASGVTILKKTEEHLPVCAACGCPAYSIDQSVLIRRSDLPRALRHGFTEQRR